MEMDRRMERQTERARWRGGKQMAAGGEVVQLWHILLLFWNSLRKFNLLVHGWDLCAGVAYFSSFIWSWLCS